MSTKVDRKKLPSRIPAGGKDSNEDQPANGNGEHMDGGDLLVTGWKENHASSSEAIIKAERHSEADSTEELQRKTVEHFTQKTTTIEKKTEDKK